MKFPVYFDHHATTPVDPRVAEVMAPYQTEHFGNPSSQGHAFGWRAEAAVETARESLASALGAADSREIVFTSGTTESDNLAILGVARAARGRGDHLVTAATEHPAVLRSCAALEAEGFGVTVLPVDGDGLVDPAAVAAALTDRTVLVSIAAANSEIGVLQPLPEIARACRERGVPLHTDAAQAVGKVAVDVDAWGVDLLSFCAHKLYGPKGVGALYVRRRRPRLRIEPLLHGGGHERGLRPGTLPVPLVVGFSRAVELCLEELPSEAPRLRGLRDGLWAALAAGLDDVHRNGHPTRRLPGNLNVSFGGVDSDAVLVEFRDAALSSGSACSSASPEPSHVLRALGLPERLLRGAVRVGLGRGNTPEEVDWLAEELVRRVRDAREKRAGAGESPRRPATQ